MFEPAPVIVDEVLEEFADPRAADAALSTYDNMTRNCNVHDRNCALVTLLT